MSMVVGNGLIAKAFKKYKGSDDIIIFASGVSNSKELRKEEFDREKELLKSYLKFKDKRFVYFSTCSVEDSSLKDSKYVWHKLEMENYIQHNFSNHIIFRLPNVVGSSGNPNTFFNYFKEKIESKTKITIDSNAFRYFIDVDDLSRLLPNLIEKTEVKSTVNVVLNNKISVSDIVFDIEKLLGIKAEKNYISKGSNYNINNSVFMDSIDEEIPEDYNLKLLKKYL